MKHRVLFHIVFVAFFLLSCSAQTKNTSIESYFDTELWIEGLFASDTKQNDVEKTVRYNEAVETKIYPSYDLSKELAIIKKNNINKPSYLGKYEKLESRLGDTLITVYNSLDDKLTVRQMKIKEIDDRIVRLNILNEDKSILSERSLRIIFEPAFFLSIKTEENNRFASDIYKDILLKFNDKQ